MKENKTLLTGILLGAIVTGALMYFFMQQQAVRESAILKNHYDEKYAALIDSVRQSGLVSFISPLMEKIERELDVSEDRILSEKTITQISTLSDGFTPYAVFKRDQLSSEVLSPERGHLLRLLLGVEMDSSSWQKILTTVTFQNADLTGAILHNVDLSNARLNHASFKDAKVTSSGFVGAHLQDVNFFGADLEDGNFQQSDLTRANLSWANLKGARMNNATLNGADLTSANIRQADLRFAIAQRVILQDAFLDESALDDIDLLESSLDQSHLSHTSFRRANLVLTTFRKTKLTEADLDSAAVKNDQWFEKAKEWGVRDVDQLQNTYTIRKDIDDHSSVIRLVKAN